MESTDYNLPVCPDCASPVVTDIRSRKLCRTHLTQLKELKLYLKAEWITDAERPKCMHPGCRMPAVYDVQVNPGKVIS